jgi:polyhydroxyalkanoate synthesis regulator phasin
LTALDPFLTALLLSFDRHLTNEVDDVRHSLPKWGYAMSKRLAGTGLAIGLVAGAGAGLILELSGNAGAAPRTSVAAVNATTDTTGTTTGTSGTTATDTADPARPDPSTRLQDVLKPLVDDGTITQAQADKVIAALVAARPAEGPGGDGPMGRHHGPGGRMGIGLDIVAKTLGITADEVRTALQSGQTIADLAVSKGKTAQDVIDAVVAEATTRLNAEVAAGTITQPDADSRLADLTTMVTAFVNNAPPAGGPGFGGRGFGGPGRPGDNDADDNGTAGTTADTSAPTTTVGS